MFIPGQILSEQLSVTKAGVWFIESNAVKEPNIVNEPAIVAKIPTTSLKAIYRGKPFYLLLAVVRKNKRHLLFSGFIVNDDPDHPLIVTHPLVNNTIHHSKSLNAILSSGETKIHFCDELNHSIASANCVFSQSQLDIASKTLKMVDVSNEFFPNIYERAHDELRRDLGRVFKNRKAEHSGIHLMKVTLRFEDTHTVTSISPNALAYISSNTIDGYRFDDEDEGGSLERSAYQISIQIFSENTFHSPFIGNSNSKRELTDILGYGKKQICFVESKALSLLGTSLDRRSTRKSSLIEKDISKGLRQLKGAVRTLIMSGGAIYHNDTLIIIPNIDSSCIHGIVLISEMYPFLDWKNIAKDIIKYSNPQKGIFFHVIDLLDFGRIGTIASSPITFSNLMKKHFNSVRSRKTAFIKKDE